MSGILQGAVLDRGPRNRILAGILGVIADKADDYGLGWPSIQTLSHQGRCSRRSVLAGIEKLEHDGWVLVGHRGMQGRGNFYVLNLKKLGVKVSAKGRRGPMWDLLGIEYGDWGARLAPENGVLKFAKPAPRQKIEQSANLFDSGISGAGFAPEMTFQDAYFGRKIDDLAASGADDPAEAISGATVAPETEISGANGDHLRCKPEHISGANGDEPFNVLNRNGTVSEQKNSPLPPSGGVLNPDLQDRWNGFLVKLKSELGSIADSLAQTKSFRTIKPGEPDYETCFRPGWWLYSMVPRGNAVLFTTGAADEAATAAGMAKYSTRIERLMRKYFGVEQELEIRVVLHRNTSS